MSYHEVVLETLPGGDATFVVRNALAAVVMAVAAFVYVSLRYKLWNGITAFVSTLGTGAIALGLLLITRVPFTAAAVYGVMVAMLVSVALSVLFANKVEQEEKNGALTDAEALSNAVPVCDTVKLCGGVAVALLVVGVVGIFCAANFAWFALVAAFGLLAAAYSALLLAPSVFLAVRKPFAKAAAEKARYDYKKGVKLPKKEEKSEETTEEEKAE
jgi:preprotein translocase subunit SecF